MLLTDVTDMKKEALRSPTSTTRQSSKSPSPLRRFLYMLSPKKEKSPTVSSPTRAGPSALFAGNKSSDLERVFRYLDQDGDGKLSPAELQNCIRVAGEELSAEDAEDVVESIDSDGDGLLGLEDFAKLVDAEGEEEKGRHIVDAFRLYEMEGEGCITPKSLRRMLKTLGEWRSIEECTAMIRPFDLNGDGVISFDEFKVMMQ